MNSVDKTASRELVNLVKILTDMTDGYVGEEEFRKVFDQSRSAVRRGKCLDLSGVSGKCLKHHPKKIQCIEQYEKLFAEVRGWGLHMEAPPMAGVVSPAYSPGDTSASIAILLACPGRFEYQAFQPAANVTGSNLEGLLFRLNMAKSSHFKFPCRYCYTIINVWPHVEYKEATGRTVPTKEELKRPHYKRRVEYLIYGHPRLLLLGDHALWAVEDLLSKFDYYHSHHPSMLALNTAYKVAASGSEATKMRLDKYSEEILKSYTRRMIRL